MSLADLSMFEIIIGTRLFLLIQQCLVHKLVQTRKKKIDRNP